ncbi:MAG: cyclic nucleotide-binding domain-containing protein [Candidatus Cloacimonetes bacterium HGW-Cloacimonetes-3]|jgi:CRP-like cAMP-binding protein|nr:MAG: cyclic nucleotide-binding domain-containing protein [Candidatus Cloacimonetes bacterium HGW-Cloacimonetes-3]
MIDISILQKVPLFNGLSQSQLETLQPLFQPLRVNKGQYVLRENTFGDQIFLLVEGCVIVTKDLVKGFHEDQASTEKVLATLCGDMLPTFGENGVLGHAARTANIIAKKDCLLFTLSKAEFDSYAVENHYAAYVVMSNIAKKLSENLQATDANLVKLATALYIAVQQ